MDKANRRLINCFKEDKNKSKSSRNIKNKDIVR